MQRKRLLVSLSLCVFFACGLFAQNPDLAIVHAVIIDGTGKPPILDGVILVHNDRIQQVGPANGITIPKDARMVDADGGSALPGLADMHVHLVGGWDGETTDMLGYHRYLNALLFAA